MSGIRSVNQSRVKRSEKLHQDQAELNKNTETPKDKIAKDNQEILPAEKTQRAQGQKTEGSRTVAQADFGAAQMKSEVQAKVPDRHEAVHSTASSAHSSADSTPKVELSKGIQGKFKKSVKDGRFSKNDATQLKSKVMKRGISEKEAATLERLQETKAGKTLDEKSQQRLSKTVTKLLEKYHEQPEVDRKEILENLKNQDLSWTASAKAGDIDLKLSKPRPYTLGEPTSTKNTSFDGRTETPALNYKMNIDNRSIDLVVEQPVAEGQYKAQEMAKALSQVRPELLKHVDRVELLNKSSGQASMQTNYWKEKGTIEVLPLKNSTRDVTQGAHILNHEIGHLQSRAKLGYDDANWQNYANAIQADGRSLSRYGDTKPTEDFSEFVTLHEIFRGTPEEAEFRALYPNRYAAAEGLITS